MNTADLKERGFQPLKAPGAYTRCAKCRADRWFQWWRAPRFGVSVASCEGCGTVPVSEQGRVWMYPVRQMAVGE